MQRPNIRINLISRQQPKVKRVAPYAQIKMYQHERPYRWALGLAILGGLYLASFRIL